MKNHSRIFILIFLVFPAATPLRAQSEKYVVAAELRISMTHQLWPDVFLNGHPLIDSQDHVFDPISNIDKRLSKEQLCCFSTANCLAIRVPQTLGSTAGTNATIGLAYVLKIVFSDHTTHWITSGQGRTSRYHLKKNGEEPEGWTIAGFEDDAWAAAKTFTPTSMAVTLINPQTRSMAEYFPTFQDDVNVYSTLGERIYFRRKFILEAAAPPDCGEPARLVPRKNRPMPGETEAPELQPTFTFTPGPAFTPGFVSTPVSPDPTATPRTIGTPSIHSTLTPVPVRNFTPRPTATPRPRIRRKPTRVPRSTPTLFIPQNTPTRTPWPTRTPPVVRKKRPAATPTPTVMATDTFAVPQAVSDAAATIVFTSPPVNIDASFGDGPGVYQLEIVNDQGAHINTIYKKQVAFKKDTWITWDGTNDEGQSMNYGRYYALLSKDGVLIEKIALAWMNPNAAGNSAD